jgi:hypothetical protein
MKLDVDQEYIDYLREKCRKQRFAGKVPKRRRKIFTSTYLTYLLSFITLS